MALKNDREYALEERKIKALERIAEKLDRLPGEEEAKLFFAQTELGLRHISDKLRKLSDVAEEISSVRLSTERVASEIHDLALSISKERR
jgi:hypothetical protein